MNSKLREEIREWLGSHGLPHNEVEGDLLIDYIIGYAEQRERETAKAFGGCTDCYGKGYATVNDRWHGYGTDGDIGGFEGRVSGGNPNAMKFCKCERGKQLATLINQQIKSVLDELEGEAEWSKSLSMSR